MLLTILHFPPLPLIHAAGVLFLTELSQNVIIWCINMTSSNTQVQNEGDLSYRTIRKLDKHFLEGTGKLTKIVRNHRIRQEARGWTLHSKPFSWGYLKAPSHLSRTFRTRDRILSLTWHTPGSRVQIQGLEGGKKGEYNICSNFKTFLRIKGTPKYCKWTSENYSSAYND